MNALCGAFRSGCRNWSGKIPSATMHCSARSPKQTGGKYYVGVDAIFRDKSPLAELLPDRTSTIIQTEAPDPQWEETWLRWMMIALCGVLCLEWLMRRLVKLA